MNVEEYNVFPTKILSIDVSEVITTSDTDTMISTIDDLILNHPDCLSKDGALKYQSKTFLFAKEAPEVFQKLRNTFLKCCEIYLQSYNFQHKFTDTRAWFFKTDNSLQQQISWHEHYPALLSGVFYLRSKEIGTIFKTSNPTSFEKEPIEIAPKDLSWTIFPSSMEHSNNSITTSNPRYVIAADYFVSL